MDPPWTPAYVKSLPAKDLPALAQALRERILATVAANGGHLASNLGVVELTIALLRTFAPPRDKILFDVSHQSYAFKLLTGRADRFHTLRTLGGLSGFQRIDEGDAFGSGHAGNALSAALGLAAARDRAGGDGHVVAVIGDASISNGVSMEALNNAVATTRRLVIVLNDNEMSISRNVGAMAKLFSRMLTNPGLVRAKIAAERFGVERLRMGGFRGRYRRLKAAIKGLFLRSSLFEDLGFQYIGPVDGHDLTWLGNALDKAVRADRPVVVHVATTKGRGYRFAEENPGAWHGTPPFEPATGRPLRPSAGRSWSAAFGHALRRIAREDPRVCALTAAMRDGTGLDGFAAEFPGRFHDVGIAEEHQATFAAGLAAAGLRPVVAVYSTFFQRAVDALIHDAALQRLPVVFCLDRAGVVANDGPTHHGLFDIALARSIPGVAILQPSDEPELEAMLRLALTLDGPVLIRYPRGSVPPPTLPPSPLALGRARIVLPALPPAAAHSAPTAPAAAPRPSPLPPIPPPAPQPLSHPAPPTAPAAASRPSPLPPIPPPAPQPLHGAARNGAAREMAAASRLSPLTPIPPPAPQPLHGAARNGAARNGAARWAALWALGDQMLALARDAAALLARRGLACEVVDARFVKPLDAALLRDELARGAALVASFENAVATGGLGTAIGEALDARAESAAPDAPPRPPLLRFGWPDDAFVPHAGSNAELFAAHGLVPEAVADRIARAFALPPFAAPAGPPR